MNSTAKDTTRQTAGQTHACCTTDEPPSRGPAVRDQVDTYPDFDFPIAGPDPLYPFFVSDAAGLGECYIQGVGPLPQKPPTPGPASPPPQLRGRDL